MPIEPYPGRGPGVYFYSVLGPSNRTLPGRGPGVYSESVLRPSNRTLPGRGLGVYSESVLGPSNRTLPGLGLGVYSESVLGPSNRTLHGRGPGVCSASCPSNPSLRRSCPDVSPVLHHLNQAIRTIRRNGPYFDQYSQALFHEYHQPTNERGESEARLQTYQLA